MRGCDVLLGKSPLTNNECDELVFTAGKKGNSHKDMRDFIFAVERTSLEEFLFGNVFQLEQGSHLRDMIFHKLTLQSIAPGELLNRRRVNHFGCVIQGVLRVTKRKERTVRLENDAYKNTTMTPRFKFKLKSQISNRSTSHRDLKSSALDMMLQSKERALSIETRKLNHKLEKILTKMQNSKRNVAVEGEALGMSPRQKKTRFQLKLSGSESKSKTYRLPQTERAGATATVLGLDGTNSLQKPFKDSTIYCQTSQNANTFHMTSAPRTDARFSSKTSFGMAYELRPGDIFDQVFNNPTDEQTVDLIALTPLKVLTLTRAQAAELISVVRPANEDTIFRLFIEAFNVPQIGYYSERLFRFVSASKVR